MKAIKLATYPLFVLLLFVSCSPQINYLGESYPPTQDVEIFFDEADIERDYKVMGVMKNEGSEIELSDAESVQEAMIKKAKSVGADAILFIGFYQEKVTGEETEVTQSGKNSTRVSSSTNTSKIFEAKLLKYR